MTLPLTLYTANQTRELDRIAIHEFGIPGFTLMQRAAQATFDQWQRAYATTRSICVLCGTGNNGGDGYLIATLAVNAGLQVCVIQLGDAQALHGDALRAYHTYLQTGAQLCDFDGRLPESDVIVDALFGTGLTRNVTGRWSDAIDAINHSGAQVVAVDVPSGLNSDTGTVMGVCVKADITVTYIGMKCGLVTGCARDYTGHIEFDDLHVPDEVYRRLSPTSSSRMIIPENIVAQTLTPRLLCSHKGHFGHVLLIGGAPGMSGAIRLAAEAALRSGAGLVTLATHPEHAAWLNFTRPEMMISAVQQAKDLLPLLKKASVVAIGPGLGQSDWGKELFSVVMSCQLPKVLDADALNLLASSAHDRIPLTKNDWILTPHPAEAARLLGSDTHQVENNRYQSIEALQRQYTGVCVLKGTGSLVSDGSNTRVCTAGNPGMASGGMGDALTGIIAALLAQGLAPFDAATVATFVHAKAGDLAAQNGERGMLASDLFPFVRTLLNNSISD